MTKPCDMLVFGGTGDLALHKLLPALYHLHREGRLPADAYATWLADFLAVPATATADWLPVGIVTDRSDPKLAHLDGLNLSRAWMLEGMAAGLPAADARRGALLAAASAHRDAALPHVTGEHYEGGHWLGSFATYLVTGRGLGD